MSYKHLGVFVCLVVMVLFSSCETYKNVPYFTDITDTTYKTIVKTPEFTNPTIQPDDILTVNVQFIDAATTELFTKSNVMSPSIGSSSTGLVGSQVIAGYLVDKEGNIELPVVGKVRLQGFTTLQATEVVRNKIALTYKNPSVDVRYANFKVTVLGEVLRPGTFSVPNEKVNILDALGMAGDLTVYGRRDNILLIRDTAAQKMLVRMNLNTKNVISSPYFFLKQNDIIYVTPDKSKAANLDVYRTRTITLAASALALLIIIATRIK